MKWIYAGLAVYAAGLYAVANGQIVIAGLCLIVGSVLIMSAGERA